MAQLLFIFVLLVVTSGVHSGNWAEYPTYEDHECVRPCVEGDPRVCTYEFNIELYQTLSKACYACPFTMADCDRPHCVPGDGNIRGIYTINRMLPGPEIQVCENDVIEVKVVNKMSNAGTSIHWHGVHQRGTPYMDGVSSVTQCIIQPHSSFTYRFIAEQPGTHYYHSHTALQRSEGIFGSLIVRQANSREPHKLSYDLDLPGHVIHFNDWFGEMTENRFTRRHHKDADDKTYFMLINGRGSRIPVENEKGEKASLPRAVFEVFQGSRFRFRAIFNGLQNCPVQLSIDNHTLTAIASDGVPFEGVEVDSILFLAGERFDFVLNTNKPVGNYWLRLKGLEDCEATKNWENAIIRYQGAPQADPPGPIGYEHAGRSGKLLNPMDGKQGPNVVSIMDLQAKVPDDVTSRPEPDIRHYLAMDFNRIDNYHFNHPVYYPIRSVSKVFQTLSPQVNNIAMKLPSAPPLSQPDDLDTTQVCNHEMPGYNRSHCSKNFCECIYVISVPLNRIVELVIIDEAIVGDEPHPMHLHGYNFRVMAMHQHGPNLDREIVKDADSKGQIPRKLSKAAVKDTVNVPNGGYTVVRFYSNNPGYWLLHCHLDFHQEIGMVLAFKVGNTRQTPELPFYFPHCDNWNNPLLPASHG